MLTVTSFSHTDLYDHLHIRHNHNYKKINEKEYILNFQYYEKDNKHPYKIQGCKYDCPACLDSN